MKNIAMRKRAEWLVNTSVQDMQSGLWQYTTQDDLDLLRLAYVIVRRRREATKCKVLASKIRKLDASLRSAELIKKEIYHE